MGKQRRRKRAGHLDVFRRAVEEEVRGEAGRAGMKELFPRTVTLIDGEKRVSLYYFIFEGKVWICDRAKMVPSSLSLGEATIFDPKSVATEFGVGSLFVHEESGITFAPYECIRIQLRPTADPEIFTSKGAVLEDFYERIREHEGLGKSGPRPSHDRSPRTARNPDAVPRPSGPEGLGRSEGGGLDRLADRAVADL